MNDKKIARRRSELLAKLDASGSSDDLIEDKNRHITTELIKLAREEDQQVVWDGAYEVAKRRRMLLAMLDAGRLSDNLFRFITAKLIELAREEDTSKKHKRKKPPAKKQPGTIRDRAIVALWENTDIIYEEDPIAALRKLVGGSDRQWQPSGTAGGPIRELIQKVKAMSPPTDVVGNTHVDEVIKRLTREDLEARPHRPK